MVDDQIPESKPSESTVTIQETTVIEAVPTDVQPRPEFVRKRESQSGKHGVRTFDEWYGAIFEYDSPEVQADLKREAVAILSQAMAGRKIPNHVYKAAEIIVTKGVFPEKRSPDSVHFHVSQYAVEQAKKRAGLPSGE